MTIKFATNVPQELRLRYLDGKEVESQFGGMQHMFSAEEGAFYVSDTVGRIISEQLRKLNVRAGEPVEIVKREVANGPRKSIQWQVAKVGFAPGEVPLDEPPQIAVRPHRSDGAAQLPASELEQKLAASIEMVKAKKAAAAADAQPEWAQVLVRQTNALVDAYAAVLGAASAKHGNAVKPEDVRSLLVSTFINLSGKNGGNRAA